MKLFEFIKLFPSQEDYAIWRKKWENDLGEWKFNYALMNFLPKWSKVNLFRATFETINSYFNHKKLNHQMYPKTKFSTQLFWKSALEEVWEKRTFTGTRTKQFIIFSSLIPKIKAVIVRKKKEREMKQRQTSDPCNIPHYEEDPLRKQIRELGLDEDSYF